MHTCTRCRKKFNSEPFISSHNGREYCSLKCIPDSGMDRPYSFEYFNLIEAFREFESRIEGIKTRKDKRELKEEIDEVYWDFNRIIYGDDEGLFYKRQIRISLTALDKLYDKLRDIRFVKRC